MIKNDQPIESAEKDALGRAAFAEELAKTILSYNQDESLVLGLYGDWGSGKTSLLNMTLEFVEKIPETKKSIQKPIVVNFNPWNFADQNQLIEQFFCMMSRILERSDAGANLQEAAKHIRTLSSIFSVGKFIPGIREFSGPIQDILRALSGSAQSLGDALEKDLDGTKAKLAELLGGQDRRILVVIDDIDRLSDKEIRQIFMLIKSVADFPKTTYLLAFDRSVVAKALNEVHRDHGFAYLEKVVQVPFDVPALSSEELRQMLYKELSESEGLEFQSMADSDLWKGIDIRGFPLFFRNLRDIKRFTNHVRLSHALVKGEVNVADFLLLKAIEVFEPSLYDGIAIHKALFCGSTDIFEVFVDPDPEKERDRKRRLDDLLERLDRIDKGLILAMLRFIFPHVDAIESGSDWQDEGSEARKEARACCHEYFDSYFRLAIGKTTYPKKEIREFIAMSHDAEHVKNKLVSLCDSNQIGPFLDMFLEHIDDIPPEHAQEAARQFMAIGDSLIGIGVPGRDRDAAFNSVEAAYKLIRLMVDDKERFETANQIVQDCSESVFCPVLFVNFLEDEKGLKRTGSTYVDDRRVCNGKQLCVLQNIVANKLSRFFDQNTSAYSGHRYCNYFLRKWASWPNGHEVHRVVCELARKDKAWAARFVYGLYDTPFEPEPFASQSEYKPDGPFFEWLTANKSTLKCLADVLADTEDLPVDESQRLGPQVHKCIAQFRAFAASKLSEVDGQQ